MPIHFVLLPPLAWWSQSLPQIEGLAQVSGCLINTSMDWRQWNIWNHWAPWKINIERESRVSLRSRSRSQTRAYAWSQTGMALQVGLRKITVIYCLCADFYLFIFQKTYLYHLAQSCSNSSALLPQPCAKPWIYVFAFFIIPWHWSIAGCWDLLAQGWPKFLRVVYTEIKIWSFW